MNASLPPSIAAQLASAQAQVAPLAPRDFLVRAPQMEGKECTLDDDRDIIFRHEQFALYLRCFDDDPEFVQLLLPNFHTMEDEADIVASLMVADRVSSHIKNVKIVTARGGDQVHLHAIADFLLADARQIAPVLMRAATSLVSAVHDFRTLLRLL